MPNAGRREKGPKCGSLPLNAGELAALFVRVDDVVGGTIEQKALVIFINLVTWLEWFQMSILCVALRHPRRQFCV